jgi:hypothetical protein
MLNLIIQEQKQFNNHEIMFHVSTLLSHSKIELQQLERKRHIGNDIVPIVFQENETIFNPECIASRFLHAYLVITVADLGFYKPGALFSNGGALIGKNHILRPIRGSINSFFVCFCWKKSKIFLEGRDDRPIALLLNPPLCYNTN